MLIYSMSVSVDGFIADREGAFGWTAPSDELFRFHLALVSDLGAYLCGRRLYETMLVWETDPSLRENAAVAHAERFPIVSTACRIAMHGPRPYRRGRSNTSGGPMPDSGTGERVTTVLDLPSRDGLVVNAVRVDYEPGGFSRVHRHPAGAYVYVIDGSVNFGIDDREPVVLKAGDSFYEPPGALHSVSSNASQELPASMLAFFVLGEGESPTVYDGD